MLPRLIFDLVERGRDKEGKVRMSKVTRGRLRSQWAGSNVQNIYQKPNGGGGRETGKIEDTAAESGTVSVKTKEEKRVHRKAHSTTR